EMSPAYVCSCSRERVEKALITTGVEELEDMAKDEITKVSCHFCDKVYEFSPDDIRALISRAKQL
ncbi:MAG: Hsp33 family molecular chaperone HslO, partial [Clostridia bacterium]|nr:Hsp33 family molecular chaperone HslO [Clostridia bacterium]